MKIYVDADACPSAIKDILVRASARLNLPIIFIANEPVKLPASEHIKSIIVNAGPDIADDKIVELVADGDLVISEDIPLADRVIYKEAFVISTRGELYTKENIKQRLATRDLLNDLRNAGVETGGPAPLSPKDIRLFANQLDRFLTKHY
ncbi:YaiI/YqxD family protein [Spirochaetota bacterium]